MVWTIKGTNKDVQKQMRWQQEPKYKWWCRVAYLEGPPKTIIPYDESSLNVATAVEGPPIFNTEVVKIAAVKKIKQGKAGLSGEIVEIITVGGREMLLL